MTNHHLICCRSVSRRSRRRGSIVGSGGAAALILAEGARHLILAQVLGELLPPRARLLLRRLRRVQLLVELAAGYMHTARIVVVIIIARHDHGQRSRSHG
jgi:hypothetical protein